MYPADSLRDPIDMERLQQTPANSSLFHFPRFNDQLSAYRNKKQRLAFEGIPFKVITPTLMTFPTILLLQSF